MKWVVSIIVGILNALFDRLVAAGKAKMENAAPDKETADRLHEQIEETWND